MLTKIFLSCCIVLALSSCCCHSARNYNFSMFKNLVPYNDTYTEILNGKVVRTFKNLKHGEPCEYAGKWKSSKEYQGAKGYCIESAGLRCLADKCKCSDEEEQQWDPTAQYVFSNDDESYLFTGACVGKKGKRCWEYTNEIASMRSEQCLDGLTCVFDKSTMNLSQYTAYFINLLSHNMDPDMDSLEMGTCQ